MTPAGGRRGSECARIAPFADPTASSLWSPAKNQPNPCGRSTSWVSVRSAPPRARRRQLLGYCRRFGAEAWDMRKIPPRILGEVLLEAGKETQPV